MLNMTKVKGILARYDIKIKGYDNMLLAMTHSSYANEHQLKHNERIEFLGDAILGLLVAEYIYKSFTNMPEGNMSKLRATYVCEDANAKYAKEIGIDQILLLGKGEEQSGGRKRPAILSGCYLFRRWN